MAKIRLFIKDRLVWLIILKAGKSSMVLAIEGSSLGHGRGRDPLRLIMLAQVFHLLPIKPLVPSQWPHLILITSPGSHHQILLTCEFRDSISNK